MSSSTTVGAFAIISSSTNKNKNNKTKRNNNDKSRTITTNEGRNYLEITFVTGNEMKATEMEMIVNQNQRHGSVVTTTTTTSNDNDKDKTLNNHDDDNDNTTTNTILDIKLRILKVDLPEIQEVNTEAIAKNKAMLGSQLAGGPCVVEDTSLQFHALGNMPGPYIKWFQDSLGSDGLYNILAAYDDKSATAVCTLAYCSNPHADPVVFTGECKGTIVPPIQGRGFGWDSIFVPDTNDNNDDDHRSSSSSRKGNIPFSCMSTDEKNAVSHRGKAVRQWADWLLRNRKELLQRQAGRPSIGHKGLDFTSSYAEQ